MIFEVYKAIFSSEHYLKINELFKKYTSMGWSEEDSLNDVNNNFMPKLEKIINDLGFEGEISARLIGDTDGIELNLLKYNFALNAPSLFDEYAQKKDSLNIKKNSDKVSLSSGNFDEIIFFENGRIRITGYHLFYLSNNSKGIDMQKSLNDLEEFAKKLYVPKK